MSDPISDHGPEREIRCPNWPFMRRWVEEHRDGKADQWTSSSRQRATIGDDGVWR